MRGRSSEQGCCGLIGRQAAAGQGWTAGRRRCREEPGLPLVAPGQAPPVQDEVRGRQSHLRPGATEQPCLAEARGVVSRGGEVRHTEKQAAGACGARGIVEGSRGLRAEPCEHLGDGRLQEECRPER